MCVFHPSLSRTLFQIAKREGVTQLHYRRNAVLPLRARDALEQVGRARLEAERGALPARAGSAAQSENAGGKERYAHHLSKHAAILMPADGRARTIFGDQYLLQLRGGQAGKVSGLLANR